MKNENSVAKRKYFTWLILGILCIAYYVGSVIFAGIGLSLIWIWLFGGLICLLCALLTKKYGRLPLPKWLFRTLIAFILLCTLLFAFIEGCIISQMGASGEEGLDYIIVLGARVRGVNPSKALLWRINAAEEYLVDNPDTVAVLSGGKGRDEGISEAQCMFNVLTEHGIEKSRLIIEDKSTDTNENIRNSLELIGTDCKIGIVSNNFHVFRAVNIAEKYSGNIVSGIAAPYKNGLILHYMVREAVGIAVDFIEGNM